MNSFKKDIYNLSKDELQMMKELLKRDMNSIVTDNKSGVYDYEQIGRNQVRIFYLNLMIKRFQLKGKKVQVLSAIGSPVSNVMLVESFKDIDLIEEICGNNTDSKVVTKKVFKLGIANNVAGFMGAQAKA